MTCIVYVGSGECFYKLVSRLLSSKVNSDIFLDVVQSFQEEKIDNIFIPVNYS